MDKKQYAVRDIEKLDELGGFYMRHVMAITSENLDSKSAIAAELAFRDAKIAELECQLYKKRCDEVTLSRGSTPL